MNIRLKAGLEVAVGIVACTLLVAGVRLGLDKLAGIYGSDAVVNGIIFVFVSVAAYVMVGMLYDIRVNQLKYKEKLNEMVKK